MPLDSYQYLPFNVVNNPESLYHFTRQQKHMNKPPYLDIVLSNEKATFALAFYSVSLAVDLAKD